MVTSGTHVHASDEKLTDRREKSLPKIWYTRTVFYNMYLAELCSVYLC